MAKRTPDYDAVVVGAGFAGMYMLYRLRELGLSVRVFETGTSVGGTWYWNRYPGARVDTETMFYSYQFSEALQQEWDWPERYPAQADLAAYARHVADRFELWPDIQFETRVDAARWDDAAGLWTVETDDGTQVTARFCIMATGCLSAVNYPEIDGLEDFAGETYHTAHWPADSVDFAGKRVAVDSYCWLHRGAYSCSVELARGDAARPAGCRAAPSTADARVTRGRPARVSPARARVEGRRPVTRRPGYALPASPPTSGAAPNAATRAAFPRRVQNRHYSLPRRGCRWCERTHYAEAARSAHQRSWRCRPALPIHRERSVKKCWFQPEAAASRKYHRKSLYQ